ncbi:hypothetical protein [Microcoleus vaginatus]
MTTFFGIRLVLLGVATFLLVPKASMVQFLFFTYKRRSDFGQP